MSSLLCIISTYLLSGISYPVDALSLQEHFVWLLDSYVTLGVLQKRWQTNISGFVLSSVQAVLRLVSFAQNGVRDDDFVVRNKAHACLSLLCGGLADRPDELLPLDVAGSADKVVVCLAFATLSKASIESKSISKLVISQVIPVIDKLAAENVHFSQGTDLWVSFSFTNRICWI